MRFVYDDGGRKAAGYKGDTSDCTVRAIAIATRLAAGPAQAITASKMAINLWMRSISAQVVPLSLSLEEACFGSGDNKEAVTA